MNQRRGWLAALLLVLAMIAGACGGDDDPTVEGGDDNDTTTTTEGTPEFDEGTTMAKLQEAGKIKVGVKFDQPGFGLKNPTSGDVEGFDIEVAKLIAARIFGGDAEEQDDNIEFVESVSKNREPFIQDGTVDIVIATYTINDTRKEVVDFAGPYFVAKQDIMVKADNTAIKGVDTLAGKKVCTAKGSTSEKNVRAKAPSAEVVLFDTYSQCAEQLTDGRVDAVTTDNTILAGLVQASSGEFKLVENPFSDEPYGIGLKKGDDDMRDFLNDTLEEIYESDEWADAFVATLGTIGLKTPEPPKVDRYTSTGATGTGSSTTTAGSGSSTSTSAGGSGSSTSSTSTTKKP
jgi:glutamate transport system substrate-binding protein